MKKTIHTFHNPIRAQCVSHNVLSKQHTRGFACQADARWSRAANISESNCVDAYVLFFKTQIKKSLLLSDGFFYRVFIISSNIWLLFLCRGFNGRRVCVVFNRIFHS